MSRNVRIKVYPDGTRQYFWATGQGLESKPLIGDKIGNRLNEEQLLEKTAENLARAKQVIYDLARSNDFVWFITLTFGLGVNRFDYESCCDEIKVYTKHLGYLGCRWIIVPEQHENGAWHFHGLLAGPVKAVRATNAHTGQLLVDKHGREVYNLTDYKSGFTTAVKLDGSPKVATYLTKYFTKDMAIPKGKKRYWASRNLVRPQVFYDELTATEFGEIFNSARYTKQIDSPYGSFLLAET